MKILKKLSCICLLIIAYNCSSDDSNEEDTNQPTVQELLVSGKWYNQSRTPGANYTDCEKNGYIEFNADGSFKLESFDDSSGLCESLGLNMATYVLSNNRDILISFGTEEFSVIINSITQGILEVTSSDGETLTFNKSQS